jgi:hypothetical protein
VIAAAVTAVAVTAVAATEAAIGKTLAAAAAEDVLDAAVVAAGDVVVVAAAADSGPAVGVIFLRPSTLPRKVANLVAGIAAQNVAAAEDIRSAVVTTIVARGVISTIAAILRALLHHLLQSTRRKNRSCCRVNRSPNIVGVPCPNLPRRLPLQSPNASNHKSNRKNRSHASPVSPLLPMLRAVRVAGCPAGFWLALPRKESNQPNRTNR